MKAEVRMKTLLFGFSPLPAPDEAETGFPEFRTCQFLSSILEEGHELFLISRDRRVREGSRTLNREFSGKSFVHIPLSAVDFESVSLVRKLKDRIKPDLLVTAGPFFSGMIAGQVKDGEPLFIDVPGDPMAEAQLLSARSSTVHPIYRYRDAISIALKKGDYFSTISQAQRYSLIGYLGMAGRLLPNLAGYDVVGVIPPSVIPYHGIFAEKTREDPQITGDNRTIKLLSTGSFNTWFDVPTLVKGVEMAMEEVPEIEFISTGYGIRDIYSKGYEEFQNMIKASKFRERFKTVGPLPLSEFLRLINNAHLGIITDYPSYETELGERTRFLIWAGEGLPGVVTTLTSLCREFCEKGLALPYACKDPSSLKEKIIEGISPEWQRMREDIRVYSMEKYSVLSTTTPLRRWLRGDWKALPPPIPDIDIFSFQQNELIRLRRLLHKTWDSSTWRLLSKIHRLFNL